MPEDVPPDELLGPPVSEDAFGGQSALLADAPVDGLVLELPLALPVLGVADWLPGGQFAALEPALGEAVSDELVLGEAVSDELVLGDAALDEPDDESLDCAIAALESASSAPAVAAASKLSFMLGLL